MSDKLITLVMFFTVAGLAVLILVIGPAFWFLQRRKAKKCTERTTGRVVKYVSVQQDQIAPVAEYRAGNRTYRVRRKSRACITVRKRTRRPSESDARVDEKDRLHVRTGPVTPLRALAERLWPMGSEITVYYDPHHPRRSYAEKVPDRIP